MSSTDARVGWSVLELLAVLGNESDADAGLQLEAWQTAVAIGLVDLLPRALAQRAESMVEQGLLEPRAEGAVVALRLTAFETAALEQLRQRYRYVPGRKR
jgi:hypothetical protein